MECRIGENSDPDVEEKGTEKSLREENNRKRKMEEMDSEEERKNPLIKNDDIELFSDLEQMDLMSDDEDEPVDSKGNMVTLFFFPGGGGKKNIKLFAGEVRGFDPPYQSAHAHLHRSSRL